MDDAPTAASNPPVESDAPASGSPERSGHTAKHPITRIIGSRDMCQGHARCIAFAPDLIVFDNNGYIAFDQIIVPDEQVEAARAAVASCPERALALDVADGR